MLRAIRIQCVLIRITCLAWRAGFDQSNKEEPMTFEFLTFLSSVIVTDID